MSKFRKKPVVIDAVQLTWKTWSEICEFAEGHIAFPARQTRSFNDNCGEPGPEYIALDIRTSEGIMTASHGDWIIKGIKGEFYPCRPDIFAATYEKVEEEV